jgi:hypothetical protein
MYSVHKVNSPFPQRSLENQVYVDFVPKVPTQKHTAIFHQAAELRLQPRKEHDVLAIPKSAIRKTYFSNSKLQKHGKRISVTASFKIRENVLQ